MPLVSGKELKLQEAQVELEETRLGRRFWLGVTGVTATLTADLAVFIQHHYGNTVHGVGGGAMVLGAMATGLATIGSLKQTLEYTDAVKSDKRAVERAERDVAAMEEDRLIQPELELQAA